MGGVGQEVKRLREARGWVQAKLAVEAGMAPSTVNQIENGKRSPSASSLNKLAGALAVEAADLFPKAQAALPDFEDARREDVYDMVLTAARRQAEQDRQAAARALESDRPQTYFMRHDNEAMVRLLEHPPEEIAGTLVEMARRCVELEDQLTHEAAVQRTPA